MKINPYFWGLTAMLLWSSSKCTATYYIYPVENSIKNNLWKDFTLFTYQNGQVKDSVFFPAKTEKILISDRGGEGQTQLPRFDSIQIRFWDHKTKMDRNCLNFFTKGDTLNWMMCTKDRITLFLLERTHDTYDEKTRTTTFLYTVDTLDYQEAR